jgi:glycosyltransferase involved in cell wall biosynthesis
MRIHISAVICTHNRSGYLRKALQSLARQTLPTESHEIVVVDNGSTDATRDVCAEFSDVKNLRYIYEPTIGLSHARNTGWRSARGRYVAYLDDDAVACPVWLERIVEVFETVRPRPGCVGGKVEPIWEAPRPAWLSDRIKSALTIADWSDHPHALTDLGKEWLVGANIAFPVEVLEQVGGFTPRLGRIGTHLLSGEEVLLSRQALKAGYSCFYHPEIAVRHHIPEHRLEKGWFLRRYYWQGITDASIQLIEEPLPRRARAALAASKVWELMRAPAQLLKILSVTNHPGQFTDRCLHLFTVGQIAGLLSFQKD